ncbi:hypothetical protein ACPSX1_20650, partial [Escherichia coli]
MKKVLLQNHPGSEKYSFNGWEIFNSNFERMIKENKAMLLCKWGFYLTCVVAVMFGNDSNLLIVFYVQIMPD